MEVHKLSINILTNSNESTSEKTEFPPAFGTHKIRFESSERVFPVKAKNCKALSIEEEEEEEDAVAAFVEFKQQQQHSVRIQHDEEEELESSFPNRSESS